jgi:drug/metabolite transporter (DMT)-like permease
MLTAIVAALASAATFAVSSSVQHHAAENAPASADGLVRLLGYLIHRPLWLLGQFLATCAFVFHAVALHSGPLAVVQPIVVSGIVFAVPARAALSRRMPSSDALAAVALTASGLAVFLVASNPSSGRPADRGVTSIVMVAVGVLLAGVASAAAEAIRQRPRHRAFLLGVTAGVLFGLVASLLKMALQVLQDQGLLGLLTAWPTYALLAAGAGGVLTNQRAYRTAGLSASMPVLNIVNVVTALTFGFTVFREVPRHSPFMLAVEACALVGIAAGLWLLVRVEEEFLEHPVATGPAQDQPAALRD